MFGFKSQTRENLGDVDRARDQAAFRNFRHAAGSIRKDAADSIKRLSKKGRNGLKRSDSSAPGTPPHTRGRLRLKKAIFYWSDQYGAEIGPRASFVGKSGAAHEKGGIYKGQRFPQRPFMFPAMVRGIPRFARSWQGSLQSS